MQSQRLVLKLGLAAWTIVSLIAFAPLAGAAGTGYNLSFSQAAGAASVGAVDLVSLSTNDPGGATITVVFQVSGALDLTDSHYGYTVYFGESGNSGSNYATAVFSNDTHGTWLASSSGGGGYGYINYTIGSGGSSLTFPMNKSAVGPSSSFTVNAFAAVDSASSFSWIGSDYVNGGGGGSNCVINNNCPAVANAAISWLVWTAILFVVIIVVIIVVVVLVVVMRRRKPPMMQMPPQPPMTMGNPPPPPPPMNP